MTIMASEFLTLKSIGEIKRHNLQMQILWLLYQGQQSTASLLSKTLSLSLPTIRHMLDLLIEASMVEVVEIGRAHV